MSAPALLRRLKDAGVSVRYIAPDRLALSGPLTNDLIVLAQAGKAELLALVRPRAETRPCACCGKFFFSEPAATCYWCRNAKHSDRIDRIQEQPLSAIHSVNSVNANATPAHERACHGCGGGLAHDDVDGGPCYTCRKYTRYCR